MTHNLNPNSPEQFGALAALNAEYWVARSRKRVTIRPLEGSAYDVARQTYQIVVCREDAFAFYGWTVYNVENGFANMQEPSEFPKYAWRANA